MMNTKKTNFFILGAPKCGTTSMYHWLKQHSQVYFPEIKEPHFFSTDLNDKRRAITDLHEYEALYKDVRDEHTVIGDASVYYLFSKNAVDNILKFNKQAKFLIMIRNPVDMAISLHKQYLFSGIEIYKNFEKAWRLNERRVDGIGVTKLTLDPQLLHYGEVCKLGKQIERLLNKVDRDCVMFVHLEDLKKKPHRELKQVFDFLNLTPENIDLKVYNKASARKHPSLDRFIKHLNQYKKELGIGKLNTGFSKLLSFNRKEAKKQELSDSLKVELADFFYDDLELLRKLNIK